MKNLNKSISKRKTITGESALPTKEDVSMIQSLFATRKMAVDSLRALMNMFGGTPTVRTFNDLYEEYPDAKIPSTDDSDNEFLSKARMRIVK